MSADDMSIDTLGPATLHIYTFTVLLLLSYFNALSCHSLNMSDDSGFSAPPSGSLSPGAPVINVSDSNDIPKGMFNLKRMGADRALNLAKELVEKGGGNWKRTNLTVQGLHSFALSCSKCRKSFSFSNPSNFWSTHVKKCAADGAPRGQVLESRTELGESLWSKLRRTKLCNAPFVKAEIHKRE